MNDRCEHCGIETTLVGVFHEERQPFSRTVRKYCPRCCSKLRAAAVGKHSRLALGALAIGILLNVTILNSNPLFLLTNYALYYLFSKLSILPHEMGHAAMARLLGGKVFLLSVGSGRTIRTLRFFGFKLEIKAVPEGGMVISCYATKQNLRLKQSASTLAGPGANLLMAVLAWPFLDLQRVLNFGNFEAGTQPLLMFFVANLVLFIWNLVPQTARTDYGLLPNDGKRLCMLMFGKADPAEVHAYYFLMEADDCQRSGNTEAAKVWVEKGLARYPDQKMLLYPQAGIWQDLGDHPRAVECLTKLLERENLDPAMRPFLLNSIAYSNVFIGGAEKLHEADQLSREAMSAYGWNPAVIGTRGAVLARLGRYEEARPLLRESWSELNYPTHKAQLFCLMAEVEFRLGQRELALGYLDQARKFNPHCWLIPIIEGILLEPSDPNC